jgi:hypothetical protein
LERGGDGQSWNALADVSLILALISGFALARSALPLWPNFPRFSWRTRRGPIVSKIFLAAIAEPDFELVGDLLFLIGGEPIVEGQCFEAFAPAGGVVVGVPVAAGDSNATADLFDQGVAFEGMVGVVGLGHGAILWGWILGFGHGFDRAGCRCGCSQHVPGCATGCPHNCIDNIRGFDDLAGVELDWQGVEAGEFFVDAIDELLGGDDYRLSINGGSRGDRAPGGGVGQNLIADAAVVLVEAPVCRNIDVLFENTGQLPKENRAAGADYE